MADTEKSEEAKVMDVAKPGEAKPDTGTKPMVIGHRTMATDPTIKENTEESVQENAEPAQRKKIKLEPLGDTNSGTVEESETSSDSAATETASDDTKSTEETEAPVPQEPEKTEQTEEQKKQSEDDEKLEQEARLEEIIKSKEYVVPIKERSATSIKTFFLSFIIVLLLGLLVGAALIDAEIVDLGIELPFDFL